MPASPHSNSRSASAPKNWLAARLLAHPWRLLALLVGIILPLAVAGKMADEVLRRETLRFDEPILYWLHARSNPWLDYLFGAISQIGGFPGTAAIGTLGALRLGHEKRIRAGWFWGLSIGGAGVLNVIVKMFFRRDRPTLWQPFAPEHDYSFPSGHAMLSSAIAIAILLLLWPTRGRIAALAFAVCWPILVGVSRLYIGVHFPSDVLAGWCAGAAWTVGVYVILRGERDRFFKRIAQSQAATGAPVDSPTQSQQVLASVGGAAPASSLEPLGREKPAPQKLMEASRQTSRQTSNRALRRTRRGAQRK